MKTGVATGTVVSFKVGEMEVGEKGESEIVKIIGETRDGKSG